jgi:tRNA wybutosine-synthesizing protein 2
MQESWADLHKKPFVTDSGAYVPVKAGYPATHILPDRKRSGRGYQKLGDVVIFHGRCPTAGEIEDVTSRERPRGILWIFGHDGELRKPRIVLLYGSAGEVTHRESGIVYQLNVENIMFSQGNREEKRRVQALVKPGEHIADMFAGIGYFSLSLAKAGAYVHAMELNPESHQYLVQNTILNGVTDRVKAIAGDCRDLLEGTYDRIHMGHFDAVSFLNAAIRHVKPGTMLHVHMLNDRSPEIMEIIRNSGMQVEYMIHRVKKAGPCIWHLVADIEVI